MAAWFLDGKNGDLRRILGADNEPGTAPRCRLLAMTAFSVATSPVVVKLALRMSMLVGSLLNVINQGDALFGGRPIDVFKLCLTYVVPYCVSTYSATSISLQRYHERRLERS